MVPISHCPYRRDPDGASRKYANRAADGDSALRECLVGQRWLTMAISVRPGIPERKSSPEISANSEGIAKGPAKTAEMSRDDRSAFSTGVEPF